MLNKFGMDECNPWTTLMEQNIKLTFTEGKEFEDATKYKQLVGSLNYLTTTKPEISFTIGILSKFMQKPCYVVSLGSGAISWRSHKQSVPIDSTAEAEYVVATKATKEIVSLKKFLEYLQEKQLHSTPLMIDNTSAINLAKNTKFHDRTKHINTKYHLIRHQVEAKTIHLRHCSINEQIVDIFTKVLGREKFKRFSAMLGLTNILLD
eukprot:PITA_29389